MHTGPIPMNKNSKFRVKKDSKRNHTEKFERREIRNERAKLIKNAA